jgi:predicted nucleic-acid-binding Zn-ribbon protein
MSIRKPIDSRRNRPAHANQPRGPKGGSIKLVRRHRTIVSCHCCGYDAPDVDTQLPCPKCGTHYWETARVAERLMPEDA